MCVVWVEFVGSLHCSERFFHGHSGFPLSSKTCISLNLTTPQAQGPVVRSLVSANRCLRGIKTYRFPWYLTLVSANNDSSNPGLSFKYLSLLNKGYYCYNTPPVMQIFKKRELCQRLDKEKRPIKRISHRKL